MIKPISHELAYVYITGDGTIHFDEKKAKKHQRFLLSRETKRRREQEKRNQYLLELYLL